jgi:hypothetical protein
MSRLVCCTFVSTVPEISSVVLAVGVNDRSRCGLAWGSAALNDGHYRNLNGQMSKRYGKSKHNCNLWRSLLFRLKTCFDPCTGPSSGLKWSVGGVYTV